MTDEHLARFVEVLTSGPAVDGSVTTAATIGGERYEFDGLHKALARRVAELETRLQKAD